MGIREAASAAVAAQDAAKVAAKESLVIRSNQAALWEVEDKFGLKGVVVKVPSMSIDREPSPQALGDGTVVKVEDDDMTLFIEVHRYIENTGYDKWTGTYKNQTPKVDFELVDENGSSLKHPTADRRSFRSEKFEDLAGLGRVLDRLDTWLADENGEIGRRPNN